MAEVFRWYIPQAGYNHSLYGHVVYTNCEHLEFLHALKIVVTETTDFMETFQAYDFFFGSKEYQTTKIGGIITQYTY